MNHIVLEFFRLVFALMLSAFVTTVGREMFETAMDFITVDGK